MKSATESSERDANGNSLPGDITHAAVQAELEKILASPGFANADRLSRFLRHTVTEHLQGQTDKLKESLLGIDVFGRKPSYDPRTDAVVRTEAVKLRARLKEYYESEGREDPLIIDLPKGGYVPAFRIREKQEAPKPEALPELPAVESLPEPSFTWIRYAASVAFVLLMSGIAVYMTVRERTAVRNRSLAANAIAVLPFADLSPDRDQEYFCDGMTEEIIDAITKVGGFRVVARTSSFAFKGKQQDIREIGKKLNVGYVLEGSVRKDGDRLRVTAQLNSVQDGYHLWSETYERQLKDVFTVQDEISRSIVNTLQLKLASAGRMPRSVPQNLETYDLYLQGRYHWNRWRKEGAEKAIQYFQQAIAKDPNYAPAYSGLADSYTWMGFFGAMPPNEAMPRAEEYAKRALRLDNSLPDAHVSLGFVKAFYEFNWEAAGAEFKRAIELNPNSSEAHFGYSIAYLTPIARTDEAIQEMKMARDLDPLSLFINTYYGQVLVIGGQQAAAVEQYKKTLSLDANFAEAHLGLAAVYTQQRKMDQATAELAQAKEGAPPWRIDLQRAICLAVEGKKSEALDLVHKWEQPAGGAFVRPVSIASVYAELDDTADTVKWLERAYADRDGTLAYIGREWSFAEVRRSDARVRAIYSKLGFNP